jgi:nucleotide-binding universal stress UspA family protein
MTQPRTLVVPLDGSILAETALAYAATLARATGGSLRLLSVIAPEPTGLLGSPRAVGEHLEQLARDTVTQYLRVVASMLHDEGFAVAGSEVLLGEPADEIIAAADADPHAIIVMATHGRGGAARWLIGSVADKVLRLATRPTLLVCPRADVEVPRPVLLRRIVVPLDGSALAETALDMAAELATALGATLALVRVEPWLGMQFAPYGYMPDFQQTERRVAHAAAEYLDTVRRRLPADARVETVVLRGDPATALIDYTQEAPADLVVMTTHGRGGLRRAVLGSTADRLVRAGVPALFVRPVRPAHAGHAAAHTAPPVAVAPGVQVHRCAVCGRPILGAFDAEERCPRCHTHLHTCHNCVFWDTLACVLQRPEAHDAVWAGRHCPRFLFRETPERTGATSAAP